MFIETTGEVSVSLACFSSLMKTVPISTVSLHELHIDMYKISIDMFILILCQVVITS